MVDLTRLGGQNLTAEQWFAALTREVMFGAGVQIDLAGWARENQQKAPARAFFDFLEGPLLSAVSGNVVLLLDEIDVTQNLSFDTDGFFTGIREMYNRRSIEPRLHRLTFCLVGVALPSDLISDPRVTPFNIGERIVLRDFTAEEVAAYGAHLGPHGKAIIARLHHWTGGHPYLTQSICAILAERPELNKPSQVEALIQETLLQPSARENNTNLVDVARRVLYSGPKNGPTPSRADALTLYERVWRGRSVPDDESNLACANLKLSGIVKSAGGRLRVRNRIYSRVFDRKWIDANMPEQEARRQRRAYRKGLWVACAVGLPVVGAIAGLAALAVAQARRADRFAALASANARLEHKARTEQERSSFKAYAMALNETARTFEAGQYEEAMRNLVDLRQQPGRGWELSYLASRVSRFGHVTSTGKSRIGGLAYRRDGSLVTLSDDERLRVWSPGGQKLLRAIPLPGLYFYLQVNPTGDAAIVFTNRGKFARVSLATGQVEWQKTTAINHFYVADAAPGRKSIFQFNSVGSGLILGIDATTGKETWRIKVANLTFESGAVSADGSRIVFGGHEQASPNSSTRYFLGAIDVRSRKTLWLRKVEANERASFVGSVGDEKTFWIGRRNGGLERLDTSSLRSISHVHIQDENVEAVTRLAHSGRWLVSLNKGFRILDPSGNKMIGQFQTWTQVLASAMSPDGSALAVGGLDGEVTLWNLDRFDQAPADFAGRWFDPRASLSLGLGPGETFTNWRFSRDGCTLAAEHGPAPGAPSNWDVFRASDGKRLWSFGEPLNIRPVFSGNGKWIAAGLIQSKRIGLFDSRTGKRLLTTPGSYPLCFSPDDSQLLVGGGPGEQDRKLVRAFDTRSGRLTFEVRATEDLATVGAWSDDGRRLLLGGEDHVIRYYDIPSGKVLANMPGHDSQVTQLAFCKDGKHALSTGDDGTARIWILGSEDAEHTLTLPGIRGRFRACELPGGRVLASSKDAAGIFDLETGQPMMLFPASGLAEFFYATIDGKVFGLTREGRVVELSGDSVVAEGRR
jgi:WD40 repeat protein